MERCKSPPAQSLASRSAVTSPCTPSHGRTELKGMRRQAACSNLAKGRVVDPRRTRKAIPSGCRHPLRVRGPRCRAGARDGSAGRLYTPVRSSMTTGPWGVSRYSRPSASRGQPSPARCSCPTSSRSWWPGPASPARIGGRTSSRDSRGSGGSLPLTSPRRVLPRHSAPEEAGGRRWGQRHPGGQVRGLGHSHGILSGKLFFARSLAEA